MYHAVLTLWLLPVIALARADVEDVISDTTRAANAHGDNGYWQVLCVMSANRQAPRNHCLPPAVGDGQAGGATESYPLRGMIVSFADMSTATDPRDEIRPWACLPDG